MTTSELPRMLGPRLAAELTTTQAEAVTAVFDLIAAAESPHTARAWLIGINPALNGRTPLHAICQDDAAAVTVAAHDYLGTDLTSKETR